MEQQRKFSGGSRTAEEMENEGANLKIQEWSIEDRIGETRGMCGSENRWDDKSSSGGGKVKDDVGALVLGGHWDGL